MRYRYSNGAEVEAPEEKAESLRRVGFTPVETKAPAKKAASRKPSAPADNE
ncbi:MAG TPA: hypothetical protein VIP28_08355 [Nocardioides sp.]